tara:strand:+ start:70498 stop:70686 length:189 start_codon:yes stop_codon:yes gene_type:complete
MTTRFTRVLLFGLLIGVFSSTACVVKARPGRSKHNVHEQKHEKHKKHKKQKKQKKPKKHKNR